MPPAVYIPHRNGSISFPADSPPIYHPNEGIIPTNTVTGRDNNQGLEGLTVSSDGRTLYALLQSALDQEGGPNNPAHVPPYKPGYSNTTSHSASLNTKPNTSSRCPLHQPYRQRILSQQSRRTIRDPLARQRTIPSIIARQQRWPRRLLPPLRLPPCRHFRHLQLHRRHRHHITTNDSTNGSIASAAGLFLRQVILILFAENGEIPYPPKTRFCQTDADWWHRVHDFRPISVQRRRRVQS